MTQIYRGEMNWKWMTKTVTQMLASSQNTLSIWIFSAAILAVYSQLFEIYNFIFSRSAVYRFTVGAGSLGANAVDLLLKNLKFFGIWMTGNFDHWYITVTTGRIYFNTMWKSCMNML